MGSEVERKTAKSKSKHTRKSKSKSKGTPNSTVNDGGVENGRNGGGGKQKVIGDPRFASVHWDPRFQKAPKKETKVTIDSRFNRMFTDKSFAPSSTASLDKRGKKAKRKPDAALKHYYRLHEDEPDSNKAEKEDDSESESEETEEERAESSSESEEESASKSSESADSTTDEDGDEGLVFEEDIPEVEEENVPLVEEGTRRLAVVNLDWRHVRAVDLYVLLSSCLPKGGSILSVSIYPSEFGLQRMKEEEVCGPVGLFDDENKKKHHDGDNDGDNEIDYEKLRDYEKSRLRYYYAVVECNSVATADHIYKFCDGTELERSSNVLDLRFIPDSMEFKHSPRDVATEAPMSYEGLDFHTKALQHSNIPISWDEDEPQRIKTFRRHFTDDQLAEFDLKEFLASDVSDTDEDGNDDGSEDKLEKKKSKVDRYRALIQSGDGSDGDAEERFQDMEVTFNPGLEDLSKHILEKKNKKSESVWEEYLRKRREKKKSRNRESNDSSDDDSSDGDVAKVEDADDFFVEEPSLEKVTKMDAHGKGGKKGKASEVTDEEAEASRAELELLLADDNGDDNGVKGYNLKPKRTKGKKGKERVEEDKIPSLDYSDLRFSKLFSSPLFALDPTDPQFKRSAAYARQVAQKQRKEDLKESPGKEPPHKRTTGQLSDEPGVNGDDPNDSVVVHSKREKHELSSLVRSVKRKSQQVRQTSKDHMYKKYKKVLP